MTNRIGCPTTRKASERTAKLSFSSVFCVPVSESNRTRSTSEGCSESWVGGGVLGGGGFRK